MGLHLYSIHHAEHGLDAVERVAPAVDGLAVRLVEDQPEIRGAIVLSTCNRVEVYLDAEPGAQQLRNAVRLGLVRGMPEPMCPADIEMRSRHSNEVLWHLFEVGAGLDSMVVGEREIAGQMRRALKRARTQNTSTYLLSESFEQALRTSRKVAHSTQLAANGRSVVSVGLDLLRREWTGARVVLIGTGAYAGAVVAALNARGCHDIVVHSMSGRAESFALTHAVRVANDLTAELVEADVVIGSRGTGTPALTYELMSTVMERRDGRPLDVVDLALARDAEASVSELDGVRLLDLPTIQKHVPDASQREVARAEQLVAEGVDELTTKLRGRQLDPAVIALRDAVTAMVDDEISRLPAQRPITHDEAAHALRRLAARMVHGPTVRARQAAEAGNGEAYLDALERVYGINAELAALGETGGHRLVETINPDRLDTETCPVVGYGLTDLGEPAHLEAM